MKRVCSLALGVVAQNGWRRSPAWHPDALLHHSPVLLRRLPTRDAARQPAAGECRAEIMCLCHSMLTLVIARYVVDI